MAQQKFAPRLIVLSDSSRASPELMLARFSELARRAQPQSVLFTLRDYQLGVRARLALGVRLQAMASASDQCFGVADRADLARALGARALHLPESGFAERDVREYLGSAAFTSRACHEPLRCAEVQADAVLLSPVFDARKGRAALGLAALAQAQAAVRRAGNAVALYALGAVDAGNAAACLDAGAAGVAVIGAALAADPTPLLDALEISRR